MLEISIILSGVITLILLKIFLNVDFKKLKKLNIESNDNLSDITDKISKINQENMCKDILKKLDCKDVKVNVAPEYNSCLYTIFNNTITIGKFKEEYMKPQTIAHECIHASQNKITLWANFIFTNIYLLFWIIISVLALLNKLPNTHIFIIAFIFASLIQYIIRYSLENEAMLKAKFIAKEYIEENKLLNKEEEQVLLNEYDRVNKLGIPFMNYYQTSMNIIKIMILTFVCLI